MTVFCPLCQIPATQVLSKFKVTAQREGENEVGALLVYQCQAAHIFFLRRADLPEFRARDQAYQVVPRA
jgi:hypothetical protein